MRRGVVVDHRRLTCGHREQLGLAAALHGHEPEQRLIDGVADGDEAVVGEHGGLVATHRVGDAPTLLDVVGDASVAVVEAVVVEEDAGVLGDGPQAAAEARERLAVNRVRRAAEMTSGRAWCTCEWMANAAALTGQVPSTTLPSWSTQMRSRTRICLKLMPKGLTQNRSSLTGSRAP